MSRTLSNAADFSAKDTGGVLRGPLTLEAIAKDVGFTFPVNKTDETITAADGTAYFKYYANAIADLEAANGGTRLVVYHFDLSDAALREFSTSEARGSRIVNAADLSEEYEIIDTGLLKKIGGNYYAFTNTAFDIAMLETHVVANSSEIGGSTTEDVVLPGSTIIARILEPVDNGTYVKQTDGIFYDATNDVYREHKDYPDALALKSFAMNGDYLDNAVLYTNKVEITPTVGSDFKTAVQNFFYKYEKIGANLLKRTDASGASDYYYVFDNDQAQINYSLGAADSADLIFTVVDNQAQTNIKIGQVYRSAGSGSGSYTDDGSNYYFVFDPTVSGALTLKKFAVNSAYPNSSYWVDLASDGITHEARYLKKSAGLVEDDMNDGFNAYGENALAAYATNSNYNDNQVVYFDLNTDESVAASFTEQWVKLVNNVLYSSYYEGDVQSNTVYRSYSSSALSLETFTTGDYVINTKYAVVAATSGNYSVTNVYLKINDGLVNHLSAAAYNGIAQVSLTYISYNVYRTGLANFNSAVIQDIPVNAVVEVRGSSTIKYTRLKEKVMKKTDPVEGKYYADSSLSETTERYLFITETGVYSSVIANDALYMVSDYTSLEAYAPYIKAHGSKAYAHRTIASKKIYYDVDAGNGLTLPGFAADVSHNQTVQTFGNQTVGYYYQAIDSEGIELNDEYAWYAINLVKKTTSSVFNAYTRSALAYAATTAPLLADINYLVSTADSDISNVMYSPVLNGVLIKYASNPNEYFVFDVSGAATKLTHLSFSSNSSNLFNNNATAKYFLQNAAFVNDESIATVNYQRKLTKTDADLIYVAPVSGGSYYEAWSKNGLYNGASLASPSSTTIKEMNPSDNSLTNTYNHMAQYLLNLSNKYYSYAVYSTEGDISEPEVRYNFGSRTGAGMNLVAANDVLYIVTNISSLESGNNYMMYDVSGILLGASTGNNYLTTAEVNNVYFSVNGFLTLAAFAQNIAYDGYHYKEISIPHLDDNERYTWIAVNLVQLNSDTTKYKALNSLSPAFSAPTYLASHMTSVLNVEIDINGTTYYKGTMNGVLMNANTINATTNFFTYDVLSNDAYIANDLTHQEVATNSNYLSGFPRASVFAYHITNDPVADNHAIITLDYFEKVDKIISGLLYISPDGLSTYYESWTMDGLHEFSKLTAQQITDSASVNRHILNNNIATYDLYSHKAQRLLKLGANYYSYAVIDEVALEPQVRYNFASRTGSGMTTSSLNDKLYIVTSISDITTGDNYTMKDLSGVVLGVAGDDYLTASEVQDVYFSVDNALTLAAFSHNIVYDGYHYKKISSPNHLDDNERYTWIAVDLVQLNSDTTKYKALNATNHLDSSALAYLASNMVEILNVEVELDGDIYYKNTMDAVLMKDPRTLGGTDYANFYVYESSNESGYGTNNTLNHYQFAVGTNAHTNDPYVINDKMYVIDISSEVLLTNHDIFALNLVETVTKTNDALLYVEPVAESTYYEAWNKTGLLNAANNVHTAMTASSTTIRDISDNSIEDYVTYTHMAQYLIKTGTEYYSYAVYSTEESTSEPDVRYDFASRTGSGMTTSDLSDVLYIVTDSDNIGTGHTYTMKDLSGVVLGAATSNVYLNASEVQNVYFSVGDALTLPDFAHVKIYDGYSHKVIDSDNKDNNERYIWTAIDLVQIASDLTAFKALNATNHTNSGALAYFADKYATHSTNVELNGTTYYKVQYWDGILMDTNNVEDASYLYVYSGTNVIDREEFAISNIFDNTDIMYEISYSSTSTETLNKYKLYTPSLDNTVTRVVTAGVQVMSSASVESYEAWTTYGLYNLSELITVAGKTIYNKAGSNEQLTSKDQYLLQRAGQSKFYHFATNNAAEWLRRLKFALNDSIFGGALAVNDELYIVPNGATAFNASSNLKYTWKELYVILRAANTGLSYTKERFMVVEGHTAAYPFSEFSLDAANAAREWIEIYGLSAVSPLLPGQENDGTLQAGAGYPGISQAQDGSYIIQDEPALGYAARYGGSGAIPVGAKLVLRSGFVNLISDAIVTNVTVWYKLQRGALGNASVEDGSSNVFRSYNSAITTNTLAGVPFVLFENNEALFAIDVSGGANLSSSYVQGNMLAKSLVTKIGSESLKTRDLIVSATYYEAYGPAGLYQISELTAAGDADVSGAAIKRRAYGSKDASGNYPLDSSANNLRDFTYIEQYLLKDNSGAIYYDYAAYGGVSGVYADAYALATKAAPFAAAVDGTILYDMSGAGSTWADYSDAIANQFEGRYILDMSGGSAGSYMLRQVLPGGITRYNMVADRKYEFANNSYYASGSKYSQIGASAVVAGENRIKTTTDLLQNEDSLTNYSSYSEPGLAYYAANAANSTQVDLLIPPAASNPYSTKLDSAGRVTSFTKLITDLLAKNVAGITVFRAYNGAMTRSFWATDDTKLVGWKLLICQNAPTIANYDLIIKLASGLNYEDDQIDPSGNLYNGVSYSYVGLMNAAKANAALSLSYELSGTELSISDTLTGRLSYIKDALASPAVNYVRIRKDLLETMKVTDVAVANYFSYANVIQDELINFAQKEEEIGTNFDLAYMDASENSVLYDVSEMGSTPSAAPNTASESYMFITKGVIAPTGSSAIYIAGSKFSAYRRLANDNYAYLRTAALYSSVAVNDLVGFNDSVTGDISYSKISAAGLMTFRDPSNALHYVSFLDASGVNGLVTPTVFAASGTYANGTYLDDRSGDISGALVYSWKKDQTHVMTRVGETTYDVSGVTYSADASGALLHLFNNSVLLSLASRSAPYTVENGYIDYRFVKDEITGIIYQLLPGGQLLNTQTGQLVSSVTYRVVATNDAYVPSTSLIYSASGKPNVKKIAPGVIMELSGNSDTTNFYAYSYLGLYNAATDISMASGASVATNAAVYLMDVSEDYLTVKTQTHSKYQQNVLYQSSTVTYRSFADYSAINPRAFSTSSSFVTNDILRRCYTSGANIGQDSTANGLDYVKKLETRILQEVANTANHWVFSDTDISGVATILETFSGATYAGKNAYAVNTSTVIYIAAYPATYSNTIFENRHSTEFANLMRVTSGADKGYYAYATSVAASLSYFANTVDIASDVLTVNYQYIYDITPGASTDADKKIQYSHYDIGVLYRPSNATYRAYTDNGIVRAAANNTISTFYFDYAGGVTTLDPSNNVFKRDASGVVHNGANYGAVLGGAIALIYLKDVAANDPTDNRTNLNSMIYELADETVPGLGERSDLSNVTTLYDMLDPLGVVRYSLVKNGILSTSYVTGTGAGTNSMMAYTPLNSAALYDIAVNNTINGYDMSGTLIRELSSNVIDRVMDYKKHAAGLLMATSSTGSYDYRVAPAYPYNELGVKNYAAIDSRGGNQDFNAKRIKLTVTSSGNSNWYINSIRLYKNGSRLNLTQSDIALVIYSGYASGFGGNVPDYRLITDTLVTVANGSSIEITITFNSTIQFDSVIINGNQLTYNDWPRLTGVSIAQTLVDSYVSMTGSLSTTSTINDTFTASYAAGDSPAMTTSYITTPYIWKQQGLLTYDVSGSRITPYNNFNVASMYDARIYSTIVTASTIIDNIAQATVFPDYRPGITMRIGDVSGTTLFNEAYNVTKAEHFLVKYSNRSYYNAYEDLTSKDGLARAALVSIIPTNGTIQLGSTNWVKDSSGALLKNISGDVIYYRHYAGSNAQPNLVNSVASSLTSANAARFLLSTYDMSANLTMYNWAADYDLNLADTLMPRYLGIITSTVNGDMIYGANGLASFANQIYYADGTVNTFAFRDAPTDYTQTIVKKLAPGSVSNVTLVNGNYVITGGGVEVYKQAVIAGLSGTSPDPDTLINLVSIINDPTVTSIVVQPGASMVGASYSIIQAYCEENNGTPVYSMIEQPLYGESGNTYYHLYRGILSSTELAANLSTEGTTLATNPVGVPASAIAAYDSDANGDVAAVSRDIVIKMYSNPYKTAGVKYVLRVYKDNVATKPYYLPIVPSSVTATPASATSIDVAWTADPFASSYQVGYRVTGVGSYVYVAASVNSKTLTGLTGSTTYDIVVRSVNAYGNGSSTVAVTATTPAAIVVPTSVGLIGAFTSWNSDINFTAGNVTVDGNVYTHALTAQSITSGDEFRVRYDGSWLTINLGSAAAITVGTPAVLAQGQANLSLALSGTYDLYFNYNTLTLLVKVANLPTYPPASRYITGPVAGGWGTFVPMTNNAYVINGAVYTHKYEATFAAGSDFQIREGNSFVTTGYGPTISGSLVVGNVYTFAANGANTTSPAAAGYYAAYFNYSTLKFTFATATAP